MVVLCETPPIFFGKFGGTVISTSLVLLSQKSTHVERRTEDDKRKDSKPSSFFEYDDKRQVISGVPRLIR
ncbi:hypothetical protein B9Z55_017308 [Caenorhabditis nigoni]|uniref:Uncharacterized protein n=1 Tax=Caenorhabditis nigoni TaxID=1611254 RepID=A0A2G5T9E6_9PELO|nr:hypothetical protein B9Z55_017308 [Caenorhabditis nigoni]